MKYEHVLCDIATVVSVGRNVEVLRYNIICSVQSSVCRDMNSC